METKSFFTLLMLAFGLAVGQKAYALEFANCNDLVEYILQHPNEVKEAISNRLPVAFSNKPSDQQKKEALSLLRTRIAKELSHKDYAEVNIEQPLPSDILQYQLNAHYARINTLLETSFQDHNEQAGLVKKQFEELLKINHTNALILSLDPSIRQVTSEEAISPDELVDLLSSHFIRGLTCIHNSLKTFKQPIMNVPYAHGALQILMSITCSIALQRWFEYNLTSAQWTELLERQYQAFAYIVPPICTIFSSMK